MLMPFPTISNDNTLHTNHTIAMIQECAEALARGESCTFCSHRWVPLTHPTPRNPNPPMVLTHLPTCIYNILLEALD